MEKKEYSAPELTVVEMERRAALCVVSCETDEFCDEMALAPTSNDHLA